MVALVRHRNAAATERVYNDVCVRVLKRRGNLERARSSSNV